MVTSASASAIFTLSESAEIDASAFTKGTSISIEAFSVFSGSLRAGFSLSAGTDFTCDELSSFLSGKTVLFTVFFTVSVNVFVTSDIPPSA